MDLATCPQCSKRSMVHRKEDLYECLSCDFKRDFADKPPKKEAPWLLITIAAIVIILLLQSPNDRRPNPTPTPPTSPSQSFG